MANSKAEDQRETPVSPLSAVSPRVPRSPSGTRCMASPLGWPPGAAASPTHPGAGSSPQTHSNTNVIFDFFGYFCPRGRGDRKTSSRVVSTNLCGKKSITHHYPNVERYFWPDLGAMHETIPLVDTLVQSEKYCTDFLVLNPRMFMQRHVLLLWCVRDKGKI